MKKRPPKRKDNFQIVFIICVFFGMAMLSSWNSIISAADFFEKRLPDKHAMSYMLVGYNIGCLPVMIFCTAIAGSLDFSLFISIPILLNAILMIVIPFICTFLSQTVIAIVLMVFLSIICGVITGILNVTVFGLGSLFSSWHTQAIMIGQGIEGLISLIPLILHISIPGDNTDVIGLTFFSSSAIINMLALVGEALLHLLPYSKDLMKDGDSSKNDDAWKYSSLSEERVEEGTCIDSEKDGSGLDSQSSSINSQESVKESSGKSTTELESVLPNTSNSSSQPASSALSSSSPRRASHVTSSSPLSDGNRNYYSFTDKSVMSESSSSSSSSTSCASIFHVMKDFAKQMWHIAKKKRWWGLAIFNCYFWTLLIYPNIILAINVQDDLFNTEWSRSLWTYIKLNIFTVGDFATRFFPDCCPLYKSAKAMNIVSIARIALALFLFLAVYVKAFQHLWLICVVYAIFSLSNGYHGTIIMALACTDLTDDSERAMGGSFMAAALNIGIFCGCMLSMVLELALPK
ncbi:putative Equilibrative Nucleoside Transporter (ENT) Family Protein [Monocercomonoides exilis]|uniref:putative Equilibrative Nucleoside Transporter (ENT) Family Protein n=1 Tax=Monocercomonoides exilis TaxID=2049356 RepID=UPI003559CFFA|nr:putative Equilibrative Nucleoside Transporter (ENT) Family Protein [Monocercomonoides exilis]|eukprot:MONOS_14104.1-p1 / transcript=MONOS_14104.1 / gene=MONOS_14104 / organism=Monocercomonoides_exilis_PA203 / gene_product=Equilibrative Nucleoside Transporter (ENT) Family Protein / transcript_product=Equilibrative Nucleoside Transporter (ENT) Family Protein / location=Mono_scaffold00939:4697-7030(-) / protein_length=518 / sequence_SO=supercontig / SO=protein_coding / is_pseudo=false